eukprot:TRINITY_DN110842_c0_g1_i1.p1 TRINITY_DN110842_c0_g1~~TRINITY_DN110842_c0_g1_i1.p1  ORF type:complete len:680 (-),score=132.97 TRINITY_DN110842_c0_g1_i1:31-2070(-)
MAPPGMKTKKKESKGAQPFPVAILDDFVNLVRDGKDDDKTKARFIAIKVDAGFDWQKKLEGAAFYVDGDKVIIEAPNSETPLIASVSESSWNQLLVLSNLPSFSTDLLLAGKCQATLHVREHSEDMIKVEGVSGHVEKKIDKLLAKRSEEEEAGRKKIAKQRASVRSKCEMQTLRHSLSGVAWQMDKRMEPILADDAWNGKGEAPELNVNAEPIYFAGHTPAGAKQMTALEEMGKLKVKAFVKMKESHIHPPLVRWTMAPMDDIELKKLQFGMELLESDGMKKQTKRLAGHFKDTPEIKMLGNPGKRPRPPFGTVTLIGVRSGKKLNLFQGEVWNVQMEKSGLAGGEVGESSALQEEDEEVLRDAKTYRDKRKSAIQTFGAAKKLRTFTQIDERMNRNCEILEKDKYTDSLSARVEQQEAGKMSYQEKDAEDRRNHLPPWVENSTEPAMIYADGLEQIVPEQAMLSEPTLLSNNLVDLLKQGSKILQMSDAEALPICKTHFAISVLRARAQQSGGSKPKEAVLFARKIGALNLLVELHKIADKARGGKAGRKHLAEMLNLEAQSDLLKHFHNTLYDADKFGDSRTRIFNKRKTMFYMTIWALYLTPEFRFAITKNMVEAELKGLHRGEIQSMGEYVGCSVDTKLEKSSDVVMKFALKESPKMNEKAFLSQTRMSKKKQR